MKEPTIAASQMYKNASNFLEAYHKCIAPLCAKYDLLPLSVDIVMFLANNPEYPTAKDICKMRLLKPSLTTLCATALWSVARRKPTVAKSPCALPKRANR